MTEILKENKELDALSRERKELSSNINNEIQETEKTNETPFPKEELEKQTEKTKQLLKATVTINGEPLNLKDLIVKDGKYLLTFSAKFAGKDREIKTECTLVNQGPNNVLIKFLPKEEKPFRQVVFDNIVCDMLSSTKSKKNIDLRFIENPKETERQQLEAVKNFEIKNISNIIRDDSLGNTQFTDLNKVFVGKEVNKTGETMERPLLVTINNTSYNLGSVAFSTPTFENGKRTTKITKFPENINVLGKKLAITKTDTGFSFGNTTELKKHIVEQRNAIIALVENKTLLGSPIALAGLNNINDVWKSSNNIFLNLFGGQYALETFTVITKADDTAKPSQPETLLIGFNEGNTPHLEDAYHTSPNNVYINTQKGEDKYYFSFNINEGKLIINPIEKNNETTPLNASEKPNLIDAPKGLEQTSILSKDKETSFISKEGITLTKIPLTKNKGIWNYETPSTQIDPVHLFESIKQKLPTPISLGLLEGDLKEAFITHLTNNGIDLSARKSIPVKEGNLTMYYLIEKVGDNEFRFQKDEKLYAVCESIKDTLTKKLTNLTSLQNINLIRNDGKTINPLQNSVGKIGLFDVTTTEKRNYLNSTKEASSVSRKLVLNPGATTNTEEALNFVLTDNTIKFEDGKRKGEITLEGQKYRLSLGKDDKSYELIFKPILAKKTEEMTGE